MLPVDYTIICFTNLKVHSTKQPWKRNILIEFNKEKNTLSTSLCIYKPIILCRSVNLNSASHCIIHSVVKSSCMSSITSEKLIKRKLFSCNINVFIYILSYVNVTQQNCIPPKSKIRYFVPFSNAVVDMVLPDALMHCGIYLQYKAAASGSNANVKFSFLIPPYNI